MSDDDLPKPEPKEIDEKNATVLKHIVEDYLNPDETLSYCWHPKLRILVGGPWWCQRWEKAE